MEVLFEKAFLKALGKHASIKKAVKKKVDLVIQDPIFFGEPLKGNWQGFYLCPVKRNFIIIYLYCESCRKKGDDSVVDCADCNKLDNQTASIHFTWPSRQNVWGIEAVLYL